MRIGSSKGLAASAVGALAVAGLTAGLPAGPAGAAGPAVAFVSLFNQGHDGSIRNDGSDVTVTLAAVRLDPGATIAFEYNPNPAAGDGSPGWVSIPVAPVMTGDYARLQWSPDPSLVGTSIAVRAVATVGPSVTYATRQGVLVNGGLASVESVSLGNTTVLGFFDQPYADSGRTATHAAVTGTTSTTGGTAQLGWWNPAAQAFQGKVDAQVGSAEFKIAPGIFVYGGTFSGDLDITAFDADAGDVIAVGAEVDTDDVSAKTLYVQQVSGISASAPTVPAGQSTAVTVTVVDNNGSRPVAGAEIRRGDGSLVGYTDGAGQVHDVQPIASLPTYYVNTTDDNTYEAGTDFSTAVTTYAPTPAFVSAVTADGRVFDDDEYALGDLLLRVDDQTHTPVAAGTPVSYRVYPSGSTPPATYQTANTDAQGRVPVQFAPQGPDGDYTIDYHFGGPIDDRQFRFTAGDSTLSLAPGAGSSAPAGQIAFKAALTVAGKPLPGRRVGITYTRGLELVPGSHADAGLVNGGSRVLSLTATTDADGVLSFVVADPAEKPQGAETGGKVALATLAASGGTLTGNPDESASGSTAFGSKKGKVKIKLKGSTAGAKDKLVVKAPDSVTGEKVKFFRVVNGKLKLIKSKKLGKKGDTVLKVSDTNGNRVTTYVVKLVSSKRVKGATSKKLKLK